VDILVSIATEWRLDVRGSLLVRGQIYVYFFYARIRQAPGTTQRLPMGNGDKTARA
jgi:hypothetical protein